MTARVAYLLHYNHTYTTTVYTGRSQKKTPIPVAVGSKAWVCGRSLAGILGSKPAESMSVSCECCVLSGRGLCVWLIARLEDSERGVSECDREALIMRRPWPTWRAKFGYCYSKIKWHEESIRAWNCTIWRQVLLVGINLLEPEFYI